MVCALGDADPKNARRGRIRKCTTSRKDDSEGGNSCRCLRKSGSNLGLALVGRSPEKAQRQMEIVDSDPTRLAGTTLGDRASGHFLHQLADRGPDLVRGGHGDEQTARAGRIVLRPDELPASARTPERAPGTTLVAPAHRSSISVVIQT